MSDEHHVLASETENEEEKTNGYPAPFLDQVYEPIYVVTIFFAIIFILGLILPRKGPNRGLIRTCIAVSAFNMWIFWFTMYVAQMNPIVCPKVENTTVAWISVAWGLPAYGDSAPNTASTPESTPPTTPESTPEPS